MIGEDQSKSTQSYHFSSRADGSRRPWSKRWSWMGGNTSAWILCHDVALASLDDRRAAIDKRQPLTEQRRAFVNGALMRSESNGGSRCGGLCAGPKNLKDFRPSPAGNRRRQLGLGMKAH